MSSLLFIVYLWSSVDLYLLIFRALIDISYLTLRVSVIQNCVGLKYVSDHQKLICSLLHDLITFRINQKKRPKLYFDCQMLELSMILHEFLSTWDPTMDQHAVEDQARTASSIQLPRLQDAKKKRKKKKEALSKY